MESNEAKTMLELLAELMDEQSEHTEREAQALALYNEMRKEINTGLVSAVERISYEKKYAVIDSANDLADTIGLYLNYPELVDKYVIGFYAPNGVQVKSVCTHYLRSSGGILSAIKQKLGLSDKSGGLSDTIPTILSHGEDYGQIRALNLADKHVSLSPEKYAVLEPGKQQAVELAGVLVSYYLSSPAVLEHQAVLVLPKGMDRQQEYYGVLVRAMDTLVVPCSEVDARLMELLRGGNIKLILATGKCNDIQKTFLTALAKEIKSELLFINSMSDVYDILQAPEKNAVTNNFSNKVLMESCLSSVLWYLAEQKKALSDRMAQINKDLLGNDIKARTHTKALQQRIRGHVEELDKCADMYYASMQNILEQIDGLQQLHGDTSGYILNGHVAMYDRLLELLVAESAFFRGYKRANANDHIRSIETLCEQTDGDQAVVRTLVNDYHTRRQANSDLDAFVKYETKSALLLHKKLEMYQQLNLSAKHCADIIDNLDPPLSPMEYRLLGEGQYMRGQKEEAKANLKKALEEGDREAGQFLYDAYKSDIGLLYLADNGVARAAYEYVEHFLKSEYDRTYNADIFDRVMKYLHIAAAQEYLPALELLGDIWYDRSMADSAKNRKEFLKMALSYYTLVQKKKEPPKATRERMGIIYFEQEDYQNARLILGGVKTPQALFLLGQIYEHGYGVAADEKAALEYYEGAMNNGHGQAQVEYARLYAKIEAETKKTTVDSNTTYYSTSYYSGYYSYYSGW